MSEQTNWCGDCRFYEQSRCKIKSGYSSIRSCASLACQDFKGRDVSAPTVASIPYHNTDGTRALASDGSVIVYRGWVPCDGSTGTPMLHKKEEPMSGDEHRHSISTCSPHGMQRYDYEVISRAKATFDDGREEAVYDVSLEESKRLGMPVYRDESVLSGPSVWRSRKMPTREELLWEHRDRIDRAGLKPIDIRFSIRRFEDYAL